MKRLTSKEVSKMMEEVNQLAELTNPVMPSAVRDEARKKLKAQGKTDAEIDKLFADMDAAAQARLNPTPEQRKAQVERDRLIQQAGGGVAGEKAATERLKNNPLRFLFDIEARGRADVRTKGREALRQLGDGDIEKGLEIFRAEQEKRNNTDSSSPEPSSSSSSSNTVPAGSFNISPKGSTRRNEVEAQIKRDNAARTDDQRVQPKQPVKQEKRYSFTANGQTYNMTKAEINAKYDELRKNPTQAKAFGVASNNAIFKKPDASTVKTGNSATLSNAPKNDLARGSTPIVVNRETSQRISNALDKPVAGSMAQRLQAIRAQQGRSETSPTTQTKVQPATTANQQSSIQQKVDKVKQPVEPKTQSATGSSLGSERVAAIRARAAAARERAMQNASPSARRTIQDLQDRRNATRNQAQGNLGRPMIVTKGSGANATTRTYAAGTSKSNPNLAAEIKNARNLIKTGSGIPTGNTVKTAVNPDSSLRVTQKRNPEATAKIKKSLDI